MSIKIVDYPIRVLHIVTTMNRGGLETMIMNYYRHIDRSKVQFDFLVHCDFEADYDREIKDLGGKIYRISRLNPFSFKYHKELNDFFKNHPEYKIVHVHQDCMSSIALKAAMKNNVPIRIAHSHSSSQNKNIKYLIKKYYMKKIPKYATNLFACGQEAGDWMFSGNNYVILKNAIDTNLYKYSLKNSIAIKKELDLENKIVIGHVGNFTYPKNHNFLIDIFSEVLKINSKAVLLLVGGGTEKTNIQEKVISLGLEDKVIFMGVRNDVNKLMQAMDVFVFPSLYEGLPVTLIEAQASGLPIIKSDNVSDQCILTDNVVSISLDKSADSWAKEILNFVNSFDRKDTSLEIINNGYDISSNAKWLENYYLNEVSKIGK